MTKSLVLSTALAAGVMLAVTPSAEAAPLRPVPPVNAQAALIQDAAWSCGPRRCVWTPGYRGPVPGYAMHWPARLPELLLEARRSRQLEEEM